MTSRPPNRYKPFFEKPKAQSQLNEVHVQQPMPVTLIKRCVCVCVCVCSCMSMTRG